MDGDGVIPGYRSNSGRFGGLDLNNRLYLKKIHVLIDCMEGTYGANKLIIIRDYQVGERGGGTCGLFEGCCKGGHQILGGLLQ